MSDKERAPADEILTAKEAGKLLKVSHRTVRRMAREGRITSYRLPGSRALRFRRSDLEQAVKEVTV